MRKRQLYYRIILFWYIVAGIPVQGFCAADEEQPPLWIDFYSEGANQPQEEDNIAGFADIKIGRRIQSFFPIDFYCSGRVYKDTKGYYWNNFVRGGAGFRIHLLKNASLVLFADATAGNYLAANDHRKTLERVNRSTKAMQVNLDSLENAVMNAVSASGPVDDEFVAWTIRETLPETNIMLRRFSDSLYAIPDRSSEKYTTYMDSLKMGLSQLYNNVNFLSANYRSPSGSVSDSSLTAILQRINQTRRQIDSIPEIAASFETEPAGIRRELIAGLAFWKGWGDDYSGNPSAFIFPMRFWGDLYGDCVFTSLSRTRTMMVEQNNAIQLVPYADRHVNTVAYVNPRLGMMLANGPLGSIAVYGGVYAWLDTRGDWWNNKAALSPGMQYKPFGNIDGVIRAEYVYGTFYGRERREDPNPNSSRFHDVKIGANFWYGLGQ